MKTITASSCAVCALVLTLGCGAGDSGEGSPAAVGAPGGQAAADTSRASTAADAPENASDASNARLAQIDFEDGNQVMFDELDGGVLVSEVGPQTNARHLVSKSGMTALAAFQALAPARAVPEALMRAHARMYPEAAEAAGSQKPALPAGEPSYDPDLEHNGQFQQSALPFATFAAQMCDFPNTSPNYKQSNITFAQTRTTQNINTTYFAVGSDVGTITAKACSNNNCSSAVAIQAGFQSSGFFDAGLACTKDCSHIVGIPLGCVTICSKKEIKFDAVFTAISSRIRYHHCASFTR